MFKDRGYALVLAATFAFGLMAVFTRAADAPILTVAAWRAVFVALVFAAWTASRRLPLMPPREHLRLSVAYGVALAVASSTFVGAYALTTVANSIFFHSLAPLGVFPLAWWAFKESPSPRALVGTAIAVLGVGLLSGASIFHFAHFTDPRFLAGDILAFVSALGYAGVLVLTRKARTDGAPVLPVLTLAWVVAAVGLFAIALVFGSVSLPVHAVPWVLGLAVISTVVPFYLLNVAMERVPVGITSLLAMAEVVFATLIGVLVYRESLAPIGWVGGALVAAGILHPFLRPNESDDDVVTMSEETQQARGGRLFLRLLLLNAGALLALLEGSESGVLLVWIALISTLRLGPDLAGRRVWMKAAVAVAAVAVLVGLALRGGWSDPNPSAIAGGLAAAVWFVDRLLLAREEPGDADPWASVALLCFAAGVALTIGDHAAGPWLMLAAGLAVAVAAIALFTARLDRLAVFPPRVVGAAAVVVLAVGGIRAVPAGHVAIVERFGFPLPEPAPAGLLVRMPPPIEKITLVDVSRVRGTPLSTADQPLLTGDQALVSLDVTLYWTVATPADFALHVTDPEASLAALSRSVLVEIVGRLPQHALLTSGRRDLEGRVAVAAQAVSDRVKLGIRVESVQLRRISVPGQVQPAFLDVISAEEHKRELVNLAEAYAADVVPKARGEAKAITERAAGTAARSLAAADGHARWITGVSEGGSAAPGLTRERIWRERLAADLAAHPIVLVPRSVHVWLGAEGPVRPAEPGGK